MYSVPLFPDGCCDIADLDKGAGAFHKDNKKRKFSVFPHDYCEGVRELKNKPPQKDIA